MSPRKVDRARGSRNPIPRPRRVAGQATRSAPSTVEGADEPVDAVEKAPGTPETPSKVSLTKAEPPTESMSGGGDESMSTLRKILLGAICALLVVGGVEIGYLVLDGDRGPAKSTAERPVQVNALTARQVVDDAARAASTILAADYEAYDEGIEASTALMTDPFAEKYRETKEQVREEFIADQTEVVIDISAQGVVRADADLVVALLFLTQTTAKNKSSVTPVQYRVTVTMVNTPDGWLVDGLEAR